MKYWDASALIATIVEEANSERLRAVSQADPAVVTWWVTPVECASALIRRARVAEMEREQLTAALARLRAAAGQWTQLWPSDDVREQALRLLRVHTLRAADALQLAAAVVAAGFQPSTMEFVTLDQRLADAADEEGFKLVTGYDR